jgi:hypothetical protein
LAVWAETKNVNHVLGFGEAVFPGHLFGPDFYLVGMYFHRETTTPTHEVVVVPRVTRPIHRLPIAGEGISFPVFNESVESAVNGGEPNT